jgi:hypothetical protein
MYGEYIYSSIGLQTSLYLGEPILFRMNDLYLREPLFAHTLSHSPSRFVAFRFRASPETIYQKLWLVLLAGPQGGPVAWQNTAMVGKPPPVVAVGYFHVLIFWRTFSQNRCHHVCRNASGHVSALRRRPSRSVSELPVGLPVQTIKTHAQ